MAWLDTWRYRIKCTISSTYIDSALTHFPIALSLGSSVGITSADVTAIFTALSSNYKKLAVTTDDETTQLYVEVEDWDVSEEEAKLWVSKSGWSISSSADTVIYLYYDATMDDNTTYVGDPGSRTEVWASAFVGVYGMAQDPTAGDILDSTVDNEDVRHYDTDTKPGLEGVNSADRLLTTQEVCELLKVSKTYIYWLTHQKRIPYIKMQGHLRFRRSAIDDWLVAQEVRSGGT